MEIPLKRKYRTAHRSSQKGGHNMGTKLRPGYSKHGGQKPPYINHIPWVVVLDLTNGGKMYKRPAYSDEVSENVRNELAKKGITLPERPA